MLKIKKGLIFFALFFFSGQGITQTYNGSGLVLSRLDSIRHSTSVARYFARIYFEVTANSQDFFGEADTQAQQLTSRMRARFASYFFEAVRACEHNLPVPAEWRTYFETGNGSYMQYVLLGVNAHINGDIWRGLVASFSPEELHAVKPYYYSYYKQLVKEYKLIYEDALACSSNIRLLHQVSLGLNKQYGKLMIKRWLRRQMKLAELYFTNQPSFKRKLEKLKRKMKRLDQLVKRNI